MRKIYVIVLTTACALTLSSCVTLFGKKQTLTISSNPGGAKVYADGDYIGTTPLKLKKKSTFNYLTFVKEGYYSTRVETSTKFRASTLWNWLFTGGVGFIVDAPMS